MAVEDEGIRAQFIFLHILYLVARVVYLVICTPASSAEVVSSILTKVGFVLFLS